MKFSEIANRLTGISTPLLGVALCLCLSGLSGVLAGCHVGVSLARLTSRDPL